MPPRELSFTSYNDALAELDRLQRGYAKSGNWDLAQACEHLTFFIDGSMDGHKFKVPWIFKALFGRMVLKRILGKRKMKSGVFTPQKPLPAPGGNEATAVAKLRASLTRAGISEEIGTTRRSSAIDAGAMARVAFDSLCASSGIFGTKMKTLNVSASMSGFDIIRAAEHEGVVLMRNGHAVAMITSFDDDDAEWYARERDPTFLESIARARQQVNSGLTRSQLEVERELGLQ